MKIKKKYQGVSANRYSREPLEHRFAQKWQEENERSRLLDGILSPGSYDQKPPPATPEQHRDAASLVQWLGSTMGYIFLQSMGFTLAVPIPPKSPSRLDLATRVVMKVRGYTHPKQVAKTDREKVKMMNFARSYGVDYAAVEDQLAFEELCEVFGAWVKTLR